MEYRVVNAESSDYDWAVGKLQKEVNKLCREGWRPQGSMTVTEYEDPTAMIFKKKYRVSQPMVK